MMRQKVILISGLLKSGKSTLANEIFWKLNDLTMDEGKSLYASMYRYAFADRVKEIATEQFGWDGKKDEKGRRLLQRIGTEVGRAYNKDIWVDYFSEFMNGNSGNSFHLPYVFIIDDWRFKNEAENISFDGEGSTFKVRVKRDVERDEEQLNHASEKGLPTDEDYYDFVIENNYETEEALRKSDDFQELLDNIINFLQK